MGVINHVERGCSQTLLLCAAFRGASPNALTARGVLQAAGPLAFRLGGDLSVYKSFSWIGPKVSRSLYNHEQTLTCLSKVDLIIFMGCFIFP